MRTFPPTPRENEAHFMAWFRRVAWNLLSSTEVGWLGTTIMRCAVNECQGTRRAQVLTVQSADGRPAKKGRMKAAFKGGSST